MHELIGPVRREVRDCTTRKLKPSLKNTRLVRPTSDPNGCLPCDNDESDDANWCFNKKTRQWHYACYSHDGNIGRKNCWQCSAGTLGKSLGASQRTIMNRYNLADVTLKFPKPPMKKDYNIKDMEQCPICYDDFPNAKMFTRRCGHTFCKNCITRWQQISLTCPYCKRA